VHGQTRATARSGWSAGRGRRRGLAAVDGDIAFGVATKGMEVFSPWGNPDADTQARPCSTCVPAGGPAVPSRARAGAARSGRLLGRKGEEEERIRADGWGQAAIERKEKRKRSLADGLRLRCSWAGWQFIGELGLS
jgi:hypothetical protein